VTDAEVPLATSYIQLTALSSSTTYYWRVRAKSLTETSSWSSTWSFTTTAPTPVLDHVTITPSSASVQTGQVQAFSVKAYDANNTEITSGVTFVWTATGLTLSTVSPLTGASTTFTAGSLAGTATVAVTATQGTTIKTASVTVTVTSEVLTITNVQVANVTSTSATISWTTNQASIGTVMYGTSKPPSIPAPSTASGTTHSTTLSLLSSGTTYYFKISAAGLSGTATDDNDGNYYVFKTTAAEALAISNVQVTNVTGSSATVTWTTSKSSTGTVYYGISKTLAVTPAVSLSTGTSHSATLVLLPGTTYFKIVALSGLETATADNNGSYFTFTSLGIGTTVKEGAAFKLPQTIENKITSYAQAIPQSIRDLLPIQIPTTGFLLATQNSVSLVLSTTSDKGIARVEGWELTSPIDLGVSLSVILADNVSFTKEGQSVSLQQILANPSQYHLQLVKVSAVRRQVSILFDFERIKVPLTVGYLTGNPQSFTQLIRGSIDRGKDLIQNPDPSFVKSLLGLEETRVGVFDFEWNYWMDAQAETNGIVLSPGSVIQTLKSIFSNASNLMQLDLNMPVIYDVKTELSYVSVPSVGEITSNPAQYRDKVVGLTVNEFGGRLSIQETIKRAGVTIPVDVCVEGSVNWNNLSIPPGMDQILLAIGASNDSQDKIADQFNGRYFVVGRIVTTAQIDESWPEYPLLLIYKKERVGDINWASLADQIKIFVENEVGKLYWTLSGFSAEPIPGVTVVPPGGISVLESPLQIPEIVSVSEKIEFFIQTATPGTPLELRLENTEISKMMVKLKQTVENASVSFKKIAREEVSVPRPPENLFPGVYSYFEARFKAPTEAVDEAEISFSVLKEWLATHGASKDDVRLLRYHDGTWESLVTDFENENQTHFMYGAKTPGFSVFSVAIYKSSVAPPTGEEGPAEGLPVNLLVILTVIAAAVSVGVLSYRGRKRSGPSVAAPVAGEEKPTVPNQAQR